MVCGYEKYHIIWYSYYRMSNIFGVAEPPTYAAPAAEELFTDSDRDDEKAPAAEEKAPEAEEKSEGTTPIPKVNFFSRLSTYFFFVGQYCELSSISS